MFKFLQKIKIFYVFLWIILTTWAYYYFFLYTSSNTSNKTQNTSSVETVWTWSIKETIDVVWSAELVDEQSLRFNQAWTVTRVYFEAWDKVTKWDIIAELDNSDWQNSVKEAQINLENAKLALQELYEDVDESKILQSENTIKSTEDSIEISQKEIENLKITQANSISEKEKDIETREKELETLNTNLETREKELEIAQKELETTKKEQSNSLSNTVSNKSTTIKNIEDSFSSELTSISKIIEQADYILWVTETNRYKNDNYEVYLWAKNTSYKSQAESALLRSISSYDKLETIIDNYDNSWNTETLKSILSSIQETYKTLENTTDLTYKTLENTIASSSLTESELESKKSTIYNYKTTVQSKLNSINSSINTLNTLSNTDLISESNNNAILTKENNLKTKQSSINSAKLAIEKKEIEINNLRKTLETTKTSNTIELKNKQNNLSSLQKTLKINQESYEELLEWPTTENVTKAKNSITQAEIKLETANENLDDYVLEAPFDWVVRKIDYMVWDNLTTDSDKYAYVENPNLLEITVMLDQVDIINVDIWDKANITFDAYSTESVDAVVTWIDTTPTETSWVTSYEVTLILDDDDFDKTVLSWMTADVEIVAEEKEWVILVSTTAITTEDDKSYVTIEKNWKTTKTEVETWLVSGTKTEITDWLSVWDKIIISNYSSSSSSTETTTSTSLFGWSSWNSNRSSWGGMWGPPGWF